VAIFRLLKLERKNKSTNVACVFVFTAVKTCSKAFFGLSVVHGKSLCISRRRILKAVSV